MIPADRISSASVGNLMQYLTEEFSRAKSDRAGLEAQWVRYQRMYRARPENAVKNFPFPGSSNVVVSLIANDVDTIYARLMAMLFTPQNLWSCKEYRPEMTDYAPRLQEFLEWAQKHEIKPEDAINDWVLELCKLGTAVLKTRYNRETKKVYEFREIEQPDGTIRPFERQARVQIKDSPSVHHVPLANFYIPADASSIQAAPWCGEEFGMSEQQLKNRAAAGIYANVNRVLGYAPSFGGNLYALVQQEHDRFALSKKSNHSIQEFWLDWDIDGDGEQEALVCTMHNASRTLLRIDFNPFLNQEKPYDAARYMRVESRFYGIGIAEMLEMAQDEATTMHNQRIDNNTIANAQIIIAKKGGGIKVGEPIFPGRTFFLDEPDDLITRSMGVVANSTIGDEQLTVGYAKQRTGVNDYISGQNSPSVGYSSATTAVQQLQEGSKRFDQVLREVRAALSGVGLKVVELYQQFNQGGKPFVAMGAKDGQLVAEVLQFPTDLVRSGVLIDLTATSASYNKDVALRTNTIIMQQLQQYYMQLLQLTQIATNPMTHPAMRDVAMQAAQAGNVLLRKMLDVYGTQDADKLLPDLSNAIAANQQSLGFAGQSFGGPSPMGQGAIGSPGMGNSPTGYPGIAGLLPAATGIGQ